MDCNNPGEIKFIENLKKEIQNLVWDNTIFPEQILGYNERNVTFE